MYNQGVPTVLAATTTVAGATVIPQMGMSQATHYAVAAAAGLLAWAVVYIVQSKLFH